MVLWQAWYWRVRTLSGPPSTPRPWQLLGDWDRPSSCVSLRLLLKVFPLLCARAVRSWNLVLFLRVLVSGSHCSGWLGVAYEYEIWILRETTFFVGAMLGSTVDTCSASVLWLWTNFTHVSTMRQTRILKRFLHSVEWRSVPS